MRKPTPAIAALLALTVVLGALNIYQARKGPAPVSDAEVLRRFYERWIPLNEPTVWQNQWFGVQTLQNPMDLWITQEILWEVKPDFIIECGTWKGGSAALWANVMEQINPDARIITIDIEDMTADAQKLPIYQKKVDFIHGSSIDPKIVEDIKNRVAGKKVLVILDSAHTKEHVLKEIQSYGPMVNKGSYLIVQDTFTNGHPALPDYGAGPWEAVHEFMPTTQDFEIDKSRERLLFTFCPDGFLKKIR